MKRIWIVLVVLAICGVWFVCTRERVPAAAETREAPEAEAAAAAEFVRKFLVLLKADEMKKVRDCCDNPKADGLRGQFELLCSVELPEKPERVEYRTARSDSWSLYYPVEDGTMQIVLRRRDDGSFRFKSIYLSE